MMKIITVTVSLLLAVSCTTSDNDKTPTCADVGCDEQSLICDRAGTCTCDLGDGVKVECTITEEK